MKKIKLFALAAFAMLSTNAFAQVSEKSTDLFTYVLGTATANAEVTGMTIATDEAILTGFVNGLTDAQMETLTIPATVAGTGTTTYKVVAIGNNSGSTATTNTAFVGNTKIKKVVVESKNFQGISGGAFKGATNLADIDLSAATSLKLIGDYAFAGTGLKALDLSKTKVFTINKFLDPADATAAHQKNATLASVTLPDRWTTIGAGAFKNCNALKTFDFNTANEVWIEMTIDNTGLPPTQTITAGAFAGTAIENLDLSGTLVTSIPALTFKAAATDEYASLKTVKLNNTITALNANFRNCSALTSIDIENDEALTTLVAYEFAGCTALTSINLKNITSFAVVGGTGDDKNFGAQFNGAGLTTVTIPNAVTAIPEKAFLDCVNLATVTFTAGTAAHLTSIGSMAFAGDTKIAKITLPADFVQTNAGAIAANAFYGCTGLKTVEFKPTALATGAAKIFNTDAFANCNDNTAANLIDIQTIADFRELYATTYAITCAKFTSAGSSVTPGTIANIVWEKAKYAKSDKYYVKVLVPSASTTSAMVSAANNTKVYGAYLDQGNNTLNLCLYKVKNGLYEIQPGDPALIITDNKDITYSLSTGTGTSSWLTKDITTHVAGTYYNELKILSEDTSATELSATASASGKVIYGWVNHESVGTGWMKITSGTMKKNGLYILAAEPAAAGRLNVVWLDENGNIEEEATAIQGIQNVKAENGAIYNLAGQKVNASYKGVVIKDGKKYIQK